MTGDSKTDPSLTAPIHPRPLVIPAWVLRRLRWWLLFNMGLVLFGAGKLNVAIFALITLPFVLLGGPSSGRSCGLGGGH